MEVKPFHREVKITQTIDIPPEIKEKIKPPEEMVKPQIQIMVESDDIAGDEDIEIVETIASTTLDPWEVKEPPPKFGETSRFVVYEDAPVIIKKTQPKYPDWAKKAGIEGSVVLDVEVLTNGKPGAVEVKKSLSAGPGGFDEAAVNAVKNWEFEPAKVGGKSVACWVSFSVDFSLN